MTRTSARTAYRNLWFPAISNGKQFPMESPDDPRNLFIPLATALESNFKIENDRTKTSRTRGNMESRSPPNARIPSHRISSGEVDAVGKLGLRYGWESDCWKRLWTAKTFLETQPKHSVRNCANKLSEVVHASSCCYTEPRARTFPTGLLALFIRF